MTVRARPGHADSRGAGLKPRLFKGYPEGVAYTYESEITRIEHKSAPPESFTLAAYGLGGFEKPVGEQTNNSACWLYALAAVALIAGGMLMVRRRRAASASTSD
jgi:hypothetical protein